MRGHTRASRGTKAAESARSRSIRCWPQWVNERERPMAFTTTRAERADRSCKTHPFLSVVVAIAAGLLSTTAVAQVKAPSKSQLKAPPKAAATSPTDNQADQLNEKWLSEHNKAETATATPSAPATGSENERVSSLP